MEQNIPRSTFSKIEKSNLAEVHTVIFAIKQRNIDYLESELIEISLPGI